MARRIIKIRTTNDSVGSGADRPEPRAAPPVRPSREGSGEHLVGSLASQRNSVPMFFQWTRLTINISRKTASVYPGLVALAAVPSICLILFLLDADIREVCKQVFHRYIPSDGSNSNQINKSAIAPSLTMQSLAVQSSVSPSAAAHSVVSAAHGSCACPPSAPVPVATAVPTGLESSTRNDVELAYSANTPLIDSIGWQRISAADGFSERHGNNALAGARIQLLGTSWAHEQLGAAYAKPCSSPSQPEPPKRTVSRAGKPASEIKLIEAVAPVVTKENSIISAKLSEDDEEDCSGNAEGTLALRLAKQRGNAQSITALRAYCERLAKTAHR